MSQAATSSAPEDEFVCLFSEVFGLEKSQLLVPELPFVDVTGGDRRIDYAIKTTEGDVAFEIDGPYHYDPRLITAFQYEDDLLRQNSLITYGWRVFRWTDRQLREEPEQVKEQLSRFLESVPGLLEFDDFLPQQRGAVLELRDHQQAARDRLEQLRAEGKTIALLNLATGTGKTVIAIDDAKSLGARTLYLAHRRDLVKQTRKKFLEFWPESRPGMWLGAICDDPAEHSVLCASAQSIAKALSGFAPDTFDYLIVDEAHHAPADTYRGILHHFRPKFVLGLTATPERPDGKSVLAFFQDTCHRMTLEEAVRAGELVPIRCVRVKTNVDLSRVRFNQVQYNPRDIENTVVIPSRDDLIVRTYIEHVPGKRAVVFCVNVRHGEELAERFRDKDVSAASVSGRDSDEQRRKTLEAFKTGRTHVLCACDILNEGWDCPEVEALLMARPTLSKILYLQQLGRGTRKSADTGKHCLYVFDFVDNAGRYNAALSLHRIVGRKDYRPGGLVLAKDGEMQEEESSFGRGEKPGAVLDLALHAIDYEEVDLFNWQEAVRGMINASDLDRELAATEGTVRRAVERGVIAPDHMLPLGQRVYLYFAREHIDDVRRALGLPEVTDETIKKLFFDFVEEMDMSASYKPVLLLSFLDVANARGRARIQDLVAAFRRFYEKRAEGSLPVETPKARMFRTADLTDAEVQNVIITMPLRKFQQRRYLDYARDVAWVQFTPSLWRQLSEFDLERVRTICQTSIERYYSRRT
jgi:superfamily II DNA or RNA helicase